MRNLAAMALGLLVTGLGLYGAAAVTPMAFPGAFDAQGATFHPVALFVMLSITVVFTLFGGWLTARLVTDHAPGHAIFMSVMALVPAVMVGAIRWSAAPSLYYVVSWILMPGAAALGAAAWQRTVRRKTRDVAHRRIATT